MGSSRHILKDSSDAANAGSTSDAARSRDHTAGRDAGRAIDPLLPAPVAHELSNLLDASLRQVGLAMSRLKHHGDTATDLLDAEDAALQKLSNAGHAMKRMADLLHGHLGPVSGRLPDLVTSELRSQANVPVTRSVTLGRAVRRALLLHSTPDITVEARVDMAAADLPAEPIESFLANALINSIESIAPPQHDSGRPGGLTRGDDNQRGAHSEADPPVEPPITQTETHPPIGHILVVATVLPAPQTGDRQVVVRVTDTGPGFAPEILGGDLPRIGRTTKPDGHGIGLSLMRETADALDGSLTLENIKPRGAAVTLIYPL